MLGTATPGPHDAAVADVETRPMRLLVPTERLDDYFLSHEDTLRASDLGITRHTTDDELDQLIGRAKQALSLAGMTEQPSFWLYRIRDALRHPRDIDEARAWGFAVPVDENKEEFDPDMSSLGWWWVYDPIRVETREQRKARYLADKRLIDMRGYARVTLRAYITTKDRKVRSDGWRRFLAGNDRYRAEQAFAFIMKMKAKDPDFDLNTEQAVELLLTRAKKGILKAMPPRRDRAGQSDVWWVSDAIEDGNGNERLDEWYEFSAIKQTGRPKGARTRKRRTKAA